MLVQCLTSSLGAWPSCNPAASGCYNHCVTGKDVLAVEREVIDLRCRSQTKPFLSTSSSANSKERVSCGNVRGSELVPAASERLWRLETRACNRGKRGTEGASHRTQTKTRPSQNPATLQGSQLRAGFA